MALLLAPTDALTRTDEGWIRARWSLRNSAAPTPLPVGCGVMAPATRGLPWCAGVDAVAYGASHVGSLQFKIMDHAREIDLYARTLWDELNSCALLVTVHSAGAPGGGDIHAPNTGAPIS